MVVVAVIREGDKNSCALKKMELIMFDSCLQRLKDVIFEGLSYEGLVMVFLNNDEKDDEEEEKSAEKS